MKKPIFDADGKIVNPPKRWEKMVEFARGTADKRAISVEALLSLGVPYYELGLQDKVLGYYRTLKKKYNQWAEEDEYNQWTIEDEDDLLSRVHLNLIPERLLKVLYHTTPSRERHYFLPHLYSIGIIETGRYPKYTRMHRSAMCQIDRNGDLREMPENLDEAFRNSDNLPSQKSIQAFYAPQRLRMLLYYSTPQNERSKYLLTDQEKEIGREIGYPETDSRLRFRLMERRDEHGQILELSDQLEQAILSEEVADEDDLMTFDSV